MTHAPALTAELDYRASQGQFPTRLGQIVSRLAELDRTMDCRSNSRWVAGPRAGHSYPCVTTGIRERDTKLSFANVEARCKLPPAPGYSARGFLVRRGARRNFRTMKTGV